MKKRLKITGLVLSGLLLLALLAVGGYILYLQLNYERIPDHTPLEIGNQQEAVLKPDTDYTAVTYNIGFGAYDQKYSFFMDTGHMADGTAVQGQYGKGRSGPAVLENTERSIDLVQELDADFVLLQEVDQAADRSYFVPQDQMLIAALPEHSYVFANNFHSVFLAYPFHDPHGSVQAGLLTLSRYQLSDAQRHSYPVDESFPTKFFDLDRCFAVHRLPVEGGKELVLINSHMSAFDEGGLVRAAQLEMLNSTMTEERAKGNYVIVGGDFNHALGSDLLSAFPAGQPCPQWVARLDEEDLAEGISIAHAGNRTEVPTCRSADIPYEKGVNFVTVVDGFLVSDNIQWAAENIDADFLASDHNPVKLTFRLAPQQNTTGEEV